MKNNPFNLVKAFTDRRKSIKRDSGVYEKGGYPVAPMGAYSFYKENQYENGYSSIRAIANEFMTILPYAINEKGIEQQNVTALNKIYHPNQDMSSVDFREALAVMSLVHPKVYILVWRYENNELKQGGPLTPDNIAGYTFLENVTEDNSGEIRKYRDGLNTYDEKDVIVLKNIHPYDLSLGFSPSQAARKWTVLDDYIAEYESGFFENGAVPAGQFVIKAKTATQFNDIVKSMKERHRGAGKNNGVAYVHEPLDKLTGQGTGAQITWVPFNTDNSKLDLKSVFENVNKKIDSVYGVPASIRGDNSNNTYASVRVDEVIMSKYAVGPFALKVWSKFTHELNRVTGGLGYAITFDHVIPEIAEENKTVAETRKLDGDLINTMVDAGYTIESIVDSFGLPAKYKLLKQGAKPAKVNEDKPDVDTGKEVENAPKQELTDMQRMMNANKSLKLKQVAARDIPTLYDNLEIDPEMVKHPELRGCIMLKTQPLEVLGLVADAASDLALNVTMDRSPVPGETSPHVTLLYGLLNNGNTWKEAVDDTLSSPTQWSAEKVTIETVSYFEQPDSYAIIAHVERTSELLDGHARIGLLPNAQTFSDYRPHMTLAYIKRDADLGKWLKALGEAYNGKEIETAGIDYGDLPKVAAIEAKAVKQKALSPERRGEYEIQLEKVVLDHMTTQIEHVQASLDLSSKSITPENPVEESENESLADDMLATLLAIIFAEGSIEHDYNVDLVFEAGISTENITPFSMTSEQHAEFEAYVRKIATSYNQQTADRIRNVITSARENSLSAQEVKKLLSGVLDEAWRIKRIATSEVNRAGNLGSLYDMQNIVRQTGAEVEKVWEHFGSDTPCPLCLAMIGTVAPLDDNFVELGATVTGTDGTDYINNFIPIKTADLHPNEHCRQTYKVVRRSA